MVDGLDPAQVVGLVGVYAVVVLVTVVASVTTVRKAGYSGWWALTLLVPVVNLVMIAVFAFSEWPVSRELRVARTALAQQDAPQQPQVHDRFGWGG